MRIEFGFLGPVTVSIDGQDVTPGGLKQRALLALLVLRANETVSTDDLIEALWDKPPETALTALHGHVSSLRKLLGAERIETRSSGYSLRVIPAETDIGRFEALIARSRVEADPGSRAGLLREALALFRGEPLEDLRHEAFARERAAQLEDLRLDAVEEKADVDLELGRDHELVTELEHLVSQHPLRERLRGDLMLSLYRSGRHAQALQVMREGRRILVEELGIDPGPMLQTLERQILVHDPALTLPEVQRPLAPGRREERKLVTVLVCELGDLNTAETVDPEDSRATLRPYQDRAQAEVARFGGALERFAGDVVLAVFGAPISHEDDPERAVRAALAIRDVLAGAIEMRIGIETGDALVAIDGNPASGEPSIAGDVVKTAARLQAAAPFGDILVGDRTYRSTQHRIDFRTNSSVAITGRGAPGRVWNAIGVSSHDDKPLNREIPFVGRGYELDLVIGALARARSERRPQFVTVIGVPGIGKSRLLHELSTRANDFVWLQGRSLPYGDGVSYWALGEIVKAQAGVLETDRADVADAKLRRAAAKAVSNRADVQRVTRHLRPLIGLGDSGPADENTSEAFAAWRTFFNGIAERSPLVIALEDLHWADDGLLDFLGDLVERAGEVPLLLISTARPELLDRRPAWAGGIRNGITVSLGSLSNDETEQLVNELLPDAALTAEERVAVIARVDGNPLYAEEYARLITERGADTTLVTPATLHLLIAARLDGLPPPEKAILQDASVIGETFWMGAIAALGGGSVAALDPLLHALERKEFLRRSRRSSVEGEAEYAFHHVLVRDVAYSQIPRGERGEKHRRAAEWIESIGRREDHAELVAHHYMRALELAGAAGAETGGLEKGARLALRDAGDRAFKLASFGAARRMYEAAIKLWPASDPERPLLILRYARTRQDDENFDEGVLEKAYELLLEQGDRTGAAEAALLVAQVLWVRGNGEGARANVDRAMKLVDNEASSALRASVLTHAGRYALTADDLDRAVALGSEALQLAERLGLGSLQARNLNTIGTARMSRGELSGATDLERAITLASQIHSMEGWNASTNLSWAWLQAGDIRRGALLQERSRAIAQELGMLHFLRWNKAEQINYEYLEGHWREAEKIADEFIASIQAGSPHYMESTCRMVRGLIRLSRGDLAGSVEDTDRGHVVATKAGEPQVLHPMLVVCGVVALAAGNRERASAIADQLVAAWIRFPIRDTFESAIGARLFNDLDRAGDFISSLDRVTYTTPWHEAARGLAAGDPVAAADRYAQIGSLPDEAYARLSAAEGLLATGRRTEAAEQLDLAMAFYRSVGASEFLSTAERLLADLS